MPARFPASLIALAFAAAAFAQPASAMQEAAEAASATPASVLVFDQKLDGSAVKVSYIYAPAKSFAVVHSGEKADKSQVLGTLAVEPGDHRDLSIPLSGEAKSGDRLWISLHNAKGDGGKFDSKTDVSYWADGSLPSTNGFVVR